MNHHAGVHLGDRRKLLQIFPVEVWAQIFGHVDDPDTLFLSARASPFLKEVFEPKRTLYLFTPVLKILVEQEYLGPWRCQDILNFRQVCKYWKTAVNRLFESAPLHVNLRFDKNHQSPVLDLCNASCIRLYKLGLYQLEEEISLPFRHENNPFPSRYLEILEGRLFSTLAFERHDFAAFIPYRAATERFLEKAGHHFFYAQIVAGFNMTPVEWYCLVSKYVGLLPNLRALYIICPMVLNRHETSEISSGFLPSFPSLETLELLRLEHVPKFAMNQIFRANGQIKTLIIPEMRYTCNDILSETLNLADIHNPSAVSVSVSSPTEFGVLPQNWRLQALRLDLEQCRELLHLPAIFEQLEMYKETLTDLYLGLPRPMAEGEQVNSGECSRRTLDLPKLKTFQIFIGGNFSTEFLLGLKSLECLSISYNDTFSNIRSSYYCTNLSRTETCISFYSILTEGKNGVVKESSIWNLLPTLERVEMGSSNRTMRTFRRPRNSK